MASDWEVLGLREWAVNRLAGPMIIYFDCHSKKNGMSMRVG